MPSDQPPALPCTTTDPTPKRGEVNVILRGLFLISQRRDVIEVLIPNMGADHVYRAGDFLSEVSLPPRPISEPYLLFGIEPERTNPYRFPTEENIIFPGHWTDQLATPDAVHARILLPRPFEIISLRPMDQAIEAKSDPLHLVHDRNTCCVHVLRYRASDIGNVHLSGQSPLASFCLNGNHYVNLHVVSEPDARVSDSHTRHGFYSLINLMPGLRGAIEISTIRKLTPPKGRPDLGISDLETCSVREVSRFLRKAGEHWRKGEPYAPSENAPGDEPPLGCIPLVVDQT